MKVGVSLQQAGTVAIAGFAFLFAVAPTGSQERKGVISHPPLLKMVLPNTQNQEVAVYEAEYEPGGINPRHLHPAAITFHVLSGTGVWQEEGKPPVILKAGPRLVAGRAPTVAGAEATSKRLLKKSETRLSITLATKHAVGDSLG